MNHECPSPRADGRVDRCGLFSIPPRCSPDACSFDRMARLSAYLDELDAEYGEPDPSIVAEVEAVFSAADNKEA